MDSKTNVLACAFRKPRFPLICDFDGDLFAAGSLAVLQRRISAVELPERGKMRFCDATGESWMLLPEQMILAPEFPMRTWRKIEVIRLFNDSRIGQELGVRYPERSLGNKRLDRIVRDIAALLSQLLKIEKRDAQRRLGPAKS